MLYRIGQILFALIIGSVVLIVMRIWFTSNTPVLLIIFTIIVLFPAVIAFIINKYQYEDYYVPEADQIDLYDRSPGNILNYAFGLGRGRLYNYLANRAVLGWSIQTIVLGGSITIFYSISPGYKSAILGAIVGQTISYWLIHIWLHRIYSRGDL